MSDEIKTVANPEIFEWMKILIPTIVAFIAGAFGSVIAPWANWGIKKKEILLNDRKDLIKRARNELSQKKFEENKFVNSQIYSEIRPFLNTKTIDELESDVMICNLATRGGGAAYHLTKILDDISIIEKEWELI